MPKRKRSRTQHGRRKRRRSKKMRKYSVRLNSPFVKTMVVKHRYCEFITLNPSTTIPDAHSFSCNGMYDPDISGLGHQPIGRDEYAAVYTRYCVLGSKINVKFFSGNTSTSTGPALVGIQVREDNSFSGNATTLIEQKQSAWGVLGSAGGNKGVIQRTKKFSARKFFNVKAPNSDDNMRSASNSNPANQAYFIVFAGPIDQTADLAEVKCLVTIDYICRWSERIPLTAS